MKKVFLLLVSAALSAVFAAPAIPTREAFTIRRDGPGKPGWIHPPLSSGAAAIEVTIDAPAAGDAILQAEVIERAFYRAPVKLRKGRHVYRFRKQDFKETQPWALAWNFAHVGNLSLLEKKGRVVKVRALEVTPRPADTWYKGIQPVLTKARTINDQVWQEGLSASSLGKYPNGVAANNLSEIVGSNNFFALYGNSRRYAFLMRPVVPQGTRFQDKVTLSYLTRKVLRKGTHGETVSVTSSSAIPGFLLESSVPVEIIHFKSSTGRMIRGAVNENDLEYRTSPDVNFTGDRKQYRFTGVVLPGEKRIRLAGELTEIDFAKLQAPWFVVLWKLDPAAIRSNFWKDGYLALLVTGSGKVKLGEGAFRLGSGTFGISSAFALAARTTGAKVLALDLDFGKLGKRADTLTKLLHNYPVAVKEYYRVTPQKVLIRNEFSYKRWGTAKRQMRDYAPIPPLTSAILPFSNGIELPKTEGDIPTLHGPYRWAKGNTLEYALPNLPPDHSLYPAVPENAREAVDADFMISRFPFPLSERPFKPYRECYVMGTKAYNNRYLAMNTLLAWGSLNDASRAKTLDFLKRALTRVKSEHLWIVRRERWTGYPYLVNGWPVKTGDRYAQGDCNTMNSAYWYNVYMYAKYSGDWDFVKKEMPFMKALYPYDEMFNAWDLPATSGRCDILCASIDMDTITMMGLCALEKMAYLTGDRAFGDRVAYLRNKVFQESIAKVVMPYHLFADHNVADHYLCHGFYGSTINLEWREFHPAKETSIGARYTFSNWFGAQPEQPLLLERGIKQPYLHHYQLEVLPQMYALWDHIPSCANHDYREYVFNSLELLITFGMPEEAEKRYDAWFKMVQNSGPERFRWQPWWQGCTLYHSSFYGTISRVRAAKYGFLLRDWEPAVIREFKLAPAASTVTLKLSAPKAVTLRFASKRKVVYPGVKFLGGGEYELALARGEHTVKLLLR